MPVISGAMKACKIKKEGHTNMVSSSVGLVIPFQPTIQSKADILLSLSFAMESVKIKLLEKYGGNYTTNVMDRFDKLCSKLNYNSHSKSIAIIISPKEDKLIYLGFRVKPAVFMGKSVTLADIVANAFTEPDFMILHVQEKNIKLFETNNGTINKIYEQNRHTNTDNLYKYTSGVIELMNIKNEKPVFVYGGPQQVNTFYTSASSTQTFFKKFDNTAGIMDPTIQLIAAEISQQWNYWEPKFISDKILLAQRTGSLIQNVDDVLKALNKMDDGLLIMDKQFKEQLNSFNADNDIPNISKQLINQIGYFLERGNRIGFVEYSSLMHMGGIVLLRNSTSGNSERHYFHQSNREAETWDCIF